MSASTRIAGWTVGFVPRHKQSADWPTVHLAYKNAISRITDSEPRSRSFSAPWVLLLGSFARLEELPFTL